jgi:hypothetical protein
MSRISIIHPTRSRPDKSLDTILKWLSLGFFTKDLVEVIISMDNDDPFIDKYREIYRDVDEERIIRLYSDNKSSVEAINHAAKLARYDVLIVVSDDTDCFKNWDVKLLEFIGQKKDYIIKTEDGIQPWIITMPVMDRAYYNRTGYIYHPGFEHMFCDTYMSCVADITGRRITSDLKFRHLNDTIKDDLRKRTDATWKQGEELFIKLMKEFTPEERSRIQDPSMKNWLRNKGVR